MYVEIRGVNPVNKGAELMYLSAVSALKERLPAARPVLGLGPRNSELAKTSGQAVILGKRKGPYEVYMPSGLVRAANLFGFLGVGNWVARDSINFILDCSGFAYSSQWGDGVMHRIARTNKAMGVGSRVGIVYMPQALGPFSADGDSKYLARQVFQGAKRIFARDDVSYANIMGLLPEAERSCVRKAPDFTAALSPVEMSHDYVSCVGAVCLIPNYRMYDKGDEHAISSYNNLHSAIIKNLSERGVAHYILIHDSGKDRYVAEEWIRGSGVSVPIFECADPLMIKAILGRASLVIGSRFHGLVSALSQGIPVVATGWSHKYKMLLEDYHCGEFLIDNLEDINKAISLVCALLDQSSDLGSNVRLRLDLNSKEIKKSISLMWDDVASLIESNQAQA